MAPHLRPLASAFLPLTLAACGVTHSFDQTSDRLALCALAPGRGAEYPLVPTEPQAYAVLESLELHVVASGCGAACVDDLVQSCEVSVEGQELRVQASFSWSERSGECVLICPPIKAVCTTPPLAAGQYTVALGTRTTTLTVGGATQPAACLGAAGG